uniref:uncharacterized protein LOC118535559 isoform X3 n=1 Tax=Halichoerus grypus TaxID=9711 RepID=UPI001659198A|nr:uncharacterized protein LOC118535559 isoform X3 [Halichoerus grypus]
MLDINLSFIFTEGQKDLSQHYLLSDGFQASKLCPSILRSTSSIPGCRLDHPLLERCEHPLQLLHFPEDPAMGGRSHEPMRDQHEGFPTVRIASGRDFRSSSSWSFLLLAGSFTRSEVPELRVWVVVTQPENGREEALSPPHRLGSAAQRRLPGCPAPGPGRGPPVRSTHRVRWRRPRPGTGLSFWRLKTHLGHPHREGEGLPVPRLRWHHLCGVWGFGWRDL